MAYPKTLRNQLGISQEAFAGLINCHPGQLSMTESGKRELPFESSPFLVALEQAVAATANSPSNKVPKDAKTVKWIERHSRNCEATKLSLEFALAKATEKMEQLQRLEQVIVMLKEDPVFFADGLPSMQLSLLERKVESAQQKCTLKLVQLQVGIAGLEAELAKVSMLL